MATYLIGDVHGCYDELIALLQQVEFTPDTDTLWLTGDLVARGPGSLDVLRYVKSLGNSVRLVLGITIYTCWPYSPGLAATNLKTG